MKRDGRRRLGGRSFNITNIACCLPWTSPVIHYCLAHLISRQCRTVKHALHCPMSSTRNCRMVCPFQIPRASTRMSLIVHCVAWGSDFLNCMGRWSLLIPWAFKFHSSVSDSVMRWSHSLRLSRKRAVINPARLDDVSGWNIRLELLLTAVRRRSSIEERMLRAYRYRVHYQRRRQGEEGETHRASLFVIFILVDSG